MPDRCLLNATVFEIIAKLLTDPILSIFSNGGHILTDQIPKHTFCEGDPREHS